MSAKRMDLYTTSINVPALLYSVMLSISSTICISNNRSRLWYRKERLVRYIYVCIFQCHKYLSVFQCTKWLLSHFPVYKSATNLSFYYCSTAKRILDTNSLNTIRNKIKLTAIRTYSKFKHALRTRHLTRQLASQLSQGTLIHVSHQSPTRDDS
jgi:hypothetical protein